MTHRGQKVIVAMSGGVDSSVAAYLLLQQGYEVIGATMETGYGSAAQEAKAICTHLSIPHYVVDVRESFEQKVVCPFIDTYLQGKTPNPCVDCNHSIKFPVFFPLMEELGANWLATGHYVNLEQKLNRFVLRKGKDEKKDQSYFLYRLSQEVLSHCLFPLGNFTKEEIRDIAANAGLVCAAKKDSFDICFVAGDYRELLKARKVPLTPGNILDQQGKILGRHEGLPFYTLGQRRGVNVSCGEPVYVVELDQANNQLVMGPKQKLMANHAVVEESNFLPFAQLTEEQKVQVRIRYKAAPADALIRPLSNQQIEICFAEPQWGITPGQSAVFYQEDVLIGGGKICVND